MIRSVPTVDKAGQTPARTPTSNYLHAPPSSPVHPLLQLQSRFGNRATAAWVAQRMQNASAPVIQRADNEEESQDEQENSDETFADSASGSVQLVLTETPPYTINKVLIGKERPHGLFGSKHGSHTTSWEVFCDVVRFSITNLTIPNAIQNMKTLCEEAKALPGVSSRSEALIEPAASQYQSAAEEMKNALANAQKADMGIGQQVSALQSLILSYLKYRNSLPFSAVERTLNNGGGESARLELIRLFENGDKTDIDHDQLRGALWGLLDAKAVQDIRDGLSLVYSEENADQMEDSDDEDEWEDEEIERAGQKDLQLSSTGGGYLDYDLPEDVVTDIMARHLLTLKRAYPHTMKTVELEKHVAKFLTSQETFKLKSKKKPKKIGLDYTIKDASVKRIEKSISKSVTPKKKIRKQKFMQPEGKVHVDTTKFSVQVVLA
ncbi:MAG: hypothetical protein WCC10_04035, partial [Tumebacillaceae bacterium]